MDTAVVPTPSMSSFPAEILGEIFLASLPPLDRSGNPQAFFPWLLSHVCRHWRGSALAFPKLWSFIDVKQTQENQDRHSASVHFLETYLKRSGKHPLTFRLAYSQDTIHEHPFLECLLQHSTRWEDVCIAWPPAFTRETLTRCDPLDFPSLRSVILSGYTLDSQVRWIPLSQLKRYREYDCWWRGKYHYQWSTLAQLTSVVDLRAEFEGVFEGAIHLPNLQYASIAILSQSIAAESVLDTWELPQLQGLCLSLTFPRTPDALCPLPSQLKSLKVLRLFGTVNISNEGLTCILPELTELTDLTMEPHSRSIDAEHVFTLLTPTMESVLVPKLQSLRITQFPYGDRPAAALFAMLRARFEEILGVDFSRLCLFSLHVWKTSADMVAATAMVDRLRSCKAIEGWNIQVHEDWGDIRGRYDEFL